MTLLEQAKADRARRESRPLVEVLNMIVREKVTESWNGMDKDPAARKSAYALCYREQMVHGEIGSPLWNEWKAEHDARVQAYKAEHFPQLVKADGRN